MYLVLDEFLIKSMVEIFPDGTKATKETKSNFYLMISEKYTESSKKA